MSKVLSKKLKLREMIQEENQVGIETPILTYEVPRGQVFFLTPAKPLRLNVPIYEDIAHGGTGEETLSLTNNIVDNDSLSDNSKAQVRVASDESKTSGGVVSINYSANEITVNHDTAEDLRVWYLSDEGEVKIKITSPFASGVLQKTLLNRPLNALHSMDQFRNDLTLDRAFIIPETYHIVVSYKGDLQVGWLGSKIGELMLPYRATSRNKKKFKNIENRVNNEMVRG